MLAGLVNRTGNTSLFCAHAPALWKLANGTVYSNSTSFRDGLVYSAELQPSGHPMVLSSGYHLYLSVLHAHGLKHLAATAALCHCAAPAATPVGTAAGAVLARITAGLAGDALWDNTAGVYVNSDAWPSPSHRTPSILSE